jgi:hypothetical protein
MIPKKHLYNDNDFDISDLIRGAHPYGGTEIVSTLSGEGVVEDIIEAQMKTLEMVFRQPTLQTLAKLADELDAQGLHTLASEVDELLSNAASEPVKISLAISPRELLEDAAAYMNKAEKILAAPSVDFNTEMEAYDLFIQAKENIELASRNPGLARDRGALREMSKLDLRWKNFDRSVDGKLSEVLRISREEEEDAKFDGGSAGKPSGAGTSWAPDAEEAEYERLPEMKYDFSEKRPTRRKSRKSNPTMAKIQNAINQIMGQTVLDENGFEGDGATWQMLRKPEFNLVDENGKPVGYTNYHQLLRILEKKMGGQVSTDVAKRREDGGGHSHKDQKQTQRPSRKKDKKETTHVKIQWGPREIQFPVTRVVQNVNHKKPKAMNVSLKILRAFADAKGMQPPVLNTKDADSFRQFGKWIAIFSGAVNQGVPTDGTNPTSDKNFGTTYHRYIAYFDAMVVHAYNMADHIDKIKSREADQMANAKNIFEYLAGEWRHAKPAHPFFKIVQIPQLKEELRRDLQHRGFSDAQDRMLQPDGIITGALPRIETQIKNLLRNYGIK